METKSIGDGGVTEASKPHCSCARCRVRGLIGPVMLITLGVLFLIGEYTHYSFGQLWPVLLIVGGVILFAESIVPRMGHIDS
jgi:Domain of unknown function (DUF5668)